MDAETIYYMSEKLLSLKYGINPNNFDKLAELTQDMWVHNANTNNATQSFSYTLNMTEGIYLLIVYTRTDSGAYYDDNVNLTVRFNGREQRTIGFINEWDNSTGFHIHGWMTYNGVHLRVGDIVEVSLNKHVNYMVG